MINVVQPRGHVQGSGHHLSAGCHCEVKFMGHYQLRAICVKHTQGIKNRIERMPENEAAPAPRVSQASPSSPQPFFSR